MNLISRTHYSCERREYVFIVFQEYTIIFPSCGFYRGISIILIIDMKNVKITIFYMSQA